MGGLVTMVVVGCLVVATSGRVIEERGLSGDGGVVVNSVGGAGYNSVGVGVACDSQEPCGWQIYGDLRRHFYYLRSQCLCPSATRCVRVGDDLLQEAYVYKCRRILKNDLY